VNETLQTLLNLSELDKTLHHLLDDQHGIPKKNQELSSKIALLEKEVSAKKADLTEAENLKKDLESSIQIKTTWLADREGRINDLKTQKEYQASQKEISAAKKEIKEKEHKLQELGPKLDKLTTEYMTLTEKNEPEITKIKDQIMENKKRLSSLDANIKEQTNKRDDVKKHVTNQKALHRYEHVLRKANPALAKIDDNSICSECGTKVLPQVVNLIKVGTTIQCCARCKRILYLEEILFPENKKVENA